MSPQIHPRISPAALDYIVEQSVMSGLPMGRVLDLILTRARRQGWTVAPGSAPGIKIKGGDNDGVPEEP